MKFDDGDKTAFYTRYCVCACDVNDSDLENTNTIYVPVKT